MSQQNEFNATTEFHTTFEDGDRVIKAKWGPEVEKELYQRLLAWYRKHSAYFGEGIMQSDDPQIEAAPLLAELADEVFQFDITYMDDCK